MVTGNFQVTKFFWYVTPYHWACSSCCFKGS